MAESKENQLKFKGTIQKIYPLKSGTTQKGDEWKSVEFLVTETKEYPQSGKFNLFGVGDKADKVDKFIKYNNVGDDVEVSFNLKTKEFKGVDYTSLEAWSVYGSKEKQQTHENIKNSAVASKVLDKKFDNIVGEADQDLPF